MTLSNDPQTYDVGVIDVQTGEVNLIINTSYYGQAPTLSLDVENQILYLNNWTIGIFC